jgi:hypothetical protein
VGPTNKKQTHNIIYGITILTESSQGWEQANPAKRCALHFRDAKNAWLPTVASPRDLGAGEKRRRHAMYRCTKGAYRQNEAR